MRTGFNQKKLGKQKSEMTEVIIKMFKVNNSFIVNQCYLIYKNGVGILIDPAWDYDLINEFLVQNNIHLKAILLTHSHIDHTDLAEKFATTVNIPVFMSNYEIEYYSFKMQNLKPVFHLQKMMIDAFNILPIVTPGHTIGSTCYLIENNLFSGDTVFIEGVGICDNKNAGKLYDSVQFLKVFLSNTTLFWPGHSFGSSPGKDLNYLLKNNIYFSFKNKIDFVQFSTRKNRPNPFLFK